MTPLQMVMVVVVPAVVALIVLAVREVADVLRSPKVTREEWLPMWDPRRSRRD